MSDAIFKLQLLARAELALAEITARRAGARTGYMGVALVLCLLGLAMLNFSGYLALAERVSPALAAFLMALANAVAAAVVVSLSRRAGPSENEERMAREIRELAYKEVSEDVEEVKQRLENLADEVSSIGANVSRATSAIRFVLGMVSKSGKS